MACSKILVISDTHGRLINARAVIERLADRVSAVVHLGDMLTDARLLEASFASLPFHYVAGNCDNYFSAQNDMPTFKIIEINGTRLYLCHGHAEGVKRGYGTLAERARKTGARVALCGHTHTPFNEIVNEILCVNPGSLSYPRKSGLHPSYAVLDVPDNGDAPAAGIVELDDIAPRRFF